MTDNHKNNTGSTINLSLISHTNSGKTTLARTLLGRDVGEVRDAAHVTDLAQAYPMLSTRQGDSLLLWDTPGFGDTARLLRRLKMSGNPVGWVMSQVWDRFADRPLWCSQQAMRNAREQADVILYLINACEDPQDAAYVDMEMQILSWIGKPVVLLLNQIGPPSEGDRDGQEEQKWHTHLQRFTILRAVLTLDAFARCWVQEAVLLDTVAGLLQADKQSAFETLSDVWRKQSLSCFHDAMTTLAAQLARTACDREALSNPSWASKIRGLIKSFSHNRLSDKDAAMQRMAERLDADIHGATDRLIQRHGLQGHDAQQVLQRLHDDYVANMPLDTNTAAILGGLLSGALGGLAADIAAGGMTLGGGMVAGGITGALSAGGLAHGYNLVKGKTPTIHWSAEFYEGLVRSALLRYLAVAHFGRGRGDFAQSEHPTFWQKTVANIVSTHRTEIRSIWALGKSADDIGRITQEIETVLTICAVRLLISLYPAAAAIFHPNGAK
ncbi:DUF3482 domain-containing protein [Herminiimonas sp. CN]|uniref:DUF3482 domain-containing protein n=1 Tax=Herminiimonas sp. CN TaxID=1349818 RepID=UPI0005578A90|nr:DUF3482 domain-containing protein [Herminiimonas sp. CN]